MHQRRRALSFMATTAALIVSLVAMPQPTTAATLPGGFVEDVVGSNAIQSVTAMDFLPDGRILVTEKPGRLKVINAADPTQATTALAIENVVNTSGDRGLLGLAVDPDFATTERIYLGYTYDPAETYTASDFWNNLPSTDRALANGEPDGAGQRVTRVSSWQLNSATNYTSVVPGSEIVVLGKQSTWTNIGDPFARQARFDVPWSCVTYAPGAAPDQGVPIDDCIAQEAISHQVGALRFGADGSLWLSHGDAATQAAVDPKALRSLDRNHLTGKLLRFDKVTGKGLADNPFYQGDGSSNRSRVWASGFRNPFRFTFDSVTGTPYIGDVGWDRFEEINLGVAGASYGWPCFEGGLTAAEIAAGVSEGPGSNQVQPGYGSLPQCAGYPASGQTAPLRAWCHAPLNSTTCPAGGRSSFAGAVYRGIAYPEAYRGLWFGDIVAGWTKVLNLETGATSLVSEDFLYAVDWQIGPDGNVYYVSLGSSEVRRIRYVGGTNQQPIAAIQADPTNGVAPLTVSFDGTFSSDADGTIEAYAWDFGDGATASGPTVQHVYGTGVWLATLTVTDDLGSSSSADVTITSGNTAPVAQISSPADGTAFNTFAQLSFTGGAVDPEDGPIPDDRLVWSGILHHNDHTHEDAYIGSGANPAPYVLQDHGDDTYLEVCLTATDLGGLAGTDCIDIHPTEVEYLLTTNPAGLKVIYNGQELATPVTVTIPTGVQRSIDAPPAQNGFYFHAWSIGGARSQSITTAATNQTLTATYKTGPRIHMGVAPNVNGQWQTVTLPSPYANPVVVATPRYAPTQIGAVAKVRNVTANSFQVKVQASEPPAPARSPVEYMVVEAGVYNFAQHGIDLEAGVVYNNTVARSTSWVNQKLTPTRSFQTPIVLGQMMTGNDGDWSVFWSSGANRLSPPTSTNIRIGRHIGEDPDTTRAGENVGYVIVEAGTWAVDGRSFQAGRLSGIAGNGTTTKRPLAPAGARAVVSQSSMLDPDGSWPVLDERSINIGSTLDLFVDEDVAGDAERVHTGEFVDYFVQAATAAMPLLTPGANAVLEGNVGTTAAYIPIRLDAPSAQTVTVEWYTFPSDGGVFATTGVDFIAASGVVTIPPGHLTGTARVDVIGDTINERPFEWAAVVFHDAQGATLDLRVYGLGFLWIVDDD